MCTKAMYSNDRGAKIKTIKSKSKKPLFRKWWEDYPSINSAKFTIQNSGNMQLEPCPYQVNDKDKLAPSFCADDWKPVGFTLNPPESKRWTDIYNTRVVGIMFEKPNGSQAWFHFPINDEEDYE